MAEQRADEHTSRLTPTEYQQWVHDRITRGILLKLGAIGISGIALLGGLVSYFLKGEVQNQTSVTQKQVDSVFRDSFDKVFQRFDTAVDRLSSKLNDQVRTEIKSTLFHEMQTHDLLRKAAKEEVNQQRPEVAKQAGDAVREAIKTHTQAERVLAAIKPVIDGEFRILARQLQQEGLGGVLLKHLRPLALGQEPSAHRRQALQLLSVFSLDSGELLRDLTTVLETCRAEDSQVAAAALGAYRGKAISPIDERFVRAAVAYVRNHPATVRDPDLGPAFVSAFRNVSDTYVPVLSEAVSATETSDPLRRLMVRALAEVPGDAAAEAIVKIAADSRPTHSRQGWETLAAGDRELQWTRPDNRRQGFIHLWQAAAINKDVERDRLVAVLAKFLRQDDWSHVVRPGLTRPTVSAVEADLLLGGWVRRLGSELQRDRATVVTYLPELLVSTLSLDQALYLRGAVDAIDLVLRETPASSTTFLANFPALYRGGKVSTTDQRFLAQGVLERALETGGNLEVFRAMRAAAAKAPSAWMAVETPFSRVAARKLRSNDGEQAGELYSLLMLIDPKDGDYYLGRSRAHLVRGMKTEARADLLAAIENRGTIPRQAILEYVRFGDEDLVQTAITQRARATANPERKATYLADLGLYYVRSGAMEKALEYSETIRQQSERVGVNWLVRAFAAHKLGHKDVEDAAFGRWLAFADPENLAEIFSYVGDEFEQWARRKSGAAPLPTS